jgi:hypothetical protein
VAIKLTTTPPRQPARLLWARNATQMKVKINMYIWQGKLLESSHLEEKQVEG